MEPELKEIAQVAGRALNTTIDRVVPLTGDASTRRYYRGFGQGRSCIICLDQSLRSFEQGESNYPFIKMSALLAEHQVSVPKILGVEKSMGLIFQEDLGDLTLLSALTKQDREFEKETYRQCIDEILKIQGIKRGLPELKFDQEKLDQEMEFTIKHLFMGFMNQQRDQSHEKIIELFRAINREIASHPFLLTHRDYHSRNIMIGPKGELRVIDYQDARMGIAVYDLVSLLEDCYYQVDEANKEGLKDYYFQRNSQYFKGDRNLFLRLYDLTLLQRVFKAVGSFGYIYMLKKDLRYLKYIGFGVEKIRLVLAKYPELKPLKLLLSEKYYDQ